MLEQESRPQIFNIKIREPKIGVWGIAWVIEGENKKLKALADKVALALDLVNVENVTSAGERFDDVRILEGGVVSFDLARNKLIIANRNDRDNAGGTNEKISQAVERALEEFEN